VKSWRTYTYRHWLWLLSRTNIEWVLSIYCLLLTVEFRHLDSIQVRGWLTTFLLWPDFLEPCAAACHSVAGRVVWYKCMYYVCVSTPLFSQGGPPPLPFFSDLAPTRHFLRVYTRPTSGCVWAHTGHRQSSYDSTVRPFHLRQVFILFHVLAHFYIKMSFWPFNQTLNFF